MTTNATRFSRRTLIAVAGAAAATSTGLIAARVSAHNGEDHGSATPSASPSMMNTGTGAAYMRIANTSDAPDHLIAAATEVAKIVEIHEMKMVDGVMKMAELKDGLEIPAKGEALLEPGGYHVMLINLTQDISPDTSFPLELTFATAGTTTVTVTVTNEVPSGGEPFTVGDLAITDVWARPAPMITAGTGKSHNHDHDHGHGHDGTPEATPSH